MSKQATDKSSVRKRGIKELIGGVIVSAAGGLATFASYNSARPGGTYTVYTGIIVLGIAYAIKGLIDIAFPAGFGKSRLESDSNEVKAEATAEAEIVEEED